MTEQKENIARDILGAYPQKQQVDAFPERRYIRLMRFLAIFAFINLGFVIALSCLFFYLARNQDISVSIRDRALLFYIDPERKLLFPVERGKSRVSAMQLVVEDALRKYLTERYEFIWNLSAMSKRWGKSGYVTELSSEEVAANFITESKRSWNELRSNQRIRDVHIYSLYPVRSDLWSAYIETFDFSFGDSFQKACECEENSYACLECKAKNVIPGGRNRMKILLRANFDGVKTLRNPFGIMIYAYYPAWVYIPPKPTSSDLFWNLPSDLRPELPSFDNPKNEK